jgi:glyoxylase-like metal-dependent hydrolase (beta-lactamase superfamily II)
VRELRSGVWHWEAPHPEWEGSLRRGLVVSSYAMDDGNRLLLFDPIAPPSEVVELGAGREVAIVLTSPWHERDARGLVEQFGWPVFVPPPDTAEDLMERYGATAEQAAGGSPDVTWLLAGDACEAHLYAAGERLPVGVEAFTGSKPNDVVLWLESHRALVVGDALVDDGPGLEVAPGAWLPRGVTRKQVADDLRPLLELPVEVVLATHGGPADRAALERALA